MNLSALFIRRPVMTTLIMGGLFLFGAGAFRLLPVSDLPTVDFPTLQVSALLPGANPDTMASSVATPLERQFTTIAGLDSMSSTSTQGNTQITLQFALDRNLDAAAQDVQSAMTAASAQLPPNLPSPPTMRKVNPADQPILYLSVSGPTLPVSTLDEYGETLLAQRISTVSGVAQVQVFGSQKYAVRVQLDPKALASRGLGIDEVAQAVQAGNVNLPTGALQGAQRAFTVEATGQLETAKAFRPLVVAYRGGAPVRLDTLGEVIDSVENDKTAAWFRDERAVILAVQRQPGTNTVEVAQAVKALLPTMEREIPPAVSLHVVYDRSESIRGSVNDVEGTLLLTIVLVVLVIFAFLRSARATVIPSLALPMALVGTFVVMQLLGYSLDNLSLMALTLALGFVVDDAVVMLENIVRHVELGEGVREAALVGSKEIGFTIVSMTLSLAAVFIPVLFMGGIVGRLFREFSVTIAVAILVSGAVSLSLTPMLCSRFLKPRGEQRHGRLYRASERAFDGMRSGYEKGLRWSLEHGVLVLVILAGAAVATVPLFLRLPKGFLPSEDTGQVVVFTRAAEGISWEAMSRLQQQAAAVVAKDPNVESYISSAGARGITVANTGILFLKLKPRGERKSADEVVNELRPKFAQVAGLQAFPQNPPPINIGGQLTQGQYQFVLQGTDTQALYQAAPALEQKMRGLSALVDVVSDLQMSTPRVLVDIDRDKASREGVTPDAIETALYSAYGTRQISTIYTPTNEYQVIIELEPEYQTSPNALSLLYVRSGSGRLVPLEAMVRAQSTVGPASVNHVGQLPAVTLSFNLAPGAALGQAVNQVEAAARASLPPTVQTHFTGAAQAFQASLSGLGLLLAAAVLVIYLVLGVLYESFVHPLTILSALPLAGFGALLALWLFRTELSIYAFVGVIMLVGLVKKNGIMMIDFALDAQGKGASAEDAIFQASVIRFRPIMMTTLAALMATLPIAVGFGAGAESRRPLGIAVVGGLVFSQLLTLFATPVVFVYLDRFRTWVDGLRQRTARRRAQSRAREAPAH